MPEVTYTDRLTFVTETCITCGVHFGVPDSFQSSRLRDSAVFYCPNGHQQCYRESTEQRLRNQIASITAQKDQVEARLRDVRSDLAATERSLTATRGVVTRIKNRVTKGVCPCCNRHFANVQRHMESQHPDFSTQSS